MIVRGALLKLTVHWNNSLQTIDMQIVESKLTPVYSGGSCPSSLFKPHMTNDSNVVTEVFSVKSLQVQKLHLEPIPLKKYSYGDVEMILGQDMFHCLRPLEYFETHRKNTPIALRLPLGWALSGPSPSSSGLFPTCCEAVTRKETDSKLVDQIRSWYDIESYGA